MIDPQLEDNPIKLIISHCAGGTSMEGLLVSIINSMTEFVQQQLSVIRDQRATIDRYEAKYGPLPDDDEH